VVNQSDPFAQIAAISIETNPSHTDSNSSSDTPHSRLQHLGVKTSPAATAGHLARSTKIKVTIIVASTSIDKTSRVDTLDHTTGDLAGSGVHGTGEDVEASLLPGAALEGDRGLVATEQPQCVVLDPESVAVDAELGGLSLVAGEGDLSGSEPVHVQVLLG